VHKSCSTRVRLRNAYKVLDGKPERCRPLGRPKCRWKDAIKIDFYEIIWECLFVLGLFALGYRAMMSMCDHSNEPLGTPTN
jgi:hypothetical protein